MSLQITGIILLETGMVLTTDMQTPGQIEVVVRGSLASCQLMKLLIIGAAAAPTCVHTHARTHTHRPAREAGMSRGPAG